MAKKRAAEPDAPPPPAIQPQAAAMPAMMPTGMPTGMPAGMAPMMPAGMPNMGMPMGMPAMGMPNMMAQPNPMMAMMQMMQMMMGGVPTAAVDPSAVPFQTGQAVADGDKGLDADIIRPALLKNRIKVQEAVSLGSVLDNLCLTEDAKHSLGGIPKGCTIAMAGPPGKGKTRSCLCGLAKVAAEGNRVAFVVAEEGFYSEQASGRDDLCSRLVKIGMSATGLNEEQFAKKALSNVYVMESQYHKGQSWDDFVAKYRYLIEKEKISFVVIDSLNMLDPTKNRTADNLSALKTYNHEKGVTCVCIGQIRDTGMPVGGEALQHTADVVFLIEEMSLGSKEIADFWGGKYRDSIEVIRAVKSVTTPTFPYPIRVGRDATTGAMVVHAAQPAQYAVLPIA